MTRLRCAYTKFSPGVVPQWPSSRRLTCSSCSGSSSLKYRVWEPADPDPARGGIVERIGEPGGVTDHAEALRRALAELSLDPAEVRAVGHRVVHGGTRFLAPVVVDDGVLAEIR